ncbi:MAG: hypothetical protein JNL69_00700 [Bacteroidia bacterium]|nr:hypothetical protein [Bacteroidia bacterium]
MKTWTTRIFAKCAETGEMTEFCGQNIKAPSQNLAHEYCQTHGLGYLHISDELIMEIPCKPNSFEPDWDNAVDYDLPQQN